MIRTVPLRERLRRETRQAHDALDRSLDLMERPLSLPQFTRLLGRFHGLHRAIEPALTAILEPSLMAGRSKLAALQHDLRLCAAAGHPRPRQPDVPDLPPLTDRADALGALYVIEGSTLGGRLIARHHRQQPDIPADALHYFNVYDGHGGEMWRAVCDILNAVDDPTETDRCVRTATAVFETTRTWLDPVHWRD